MANKITREEFVDFLLKEEQENKHIGHWSKSAINSDVYWGYVIPWVDGFFPRLTVLEDKVVHHVGGIYDDPNDTEYSFEEFIKIMYE